MSVVLDANVLLRYAQPTDPAHRTVVTAIAALRAAGDIPVLVPQTIYEFWVVATRPVANNGLELAVPECEQLLKGLMAVFPVLLDPYTLLSAWRTLVTAHDCKGKLAHDARYVAAMKTLGLTRLLTFNSTDFTRYPGITVLDPHTVAASNP